MIKFNFKNYQETSEYIKDLEEDYLKVRNRANLIEEKYQIILRAFMMLKADLEKWDKELEEQE